jgi:hypothetical protein
LPSRRSLVVAVLAATALATWPGQASAKGVFTRVRVCGPAACISIRDRADRVAISRALEQSGPAFPRLGPYLRVTTRPALWDDRGYLIPAQGIVQLAGLDHRLGPRAAASLRRRVAAIAPYRPRVASVWLRGQRLGVPGRIASALRSQPIRQPPAVWSARSVLVAVVVSGATPWSGWGSALYFPALRVLHSPDGAWVRLTAAQARALSPGSVTSHPGGGVPLAPIGLAAAALLAAGALGARGVHRVQASRS